MSGRRSTHHDLPDVLDPRLRPADLLRSPGTWLPASSGIDPSALQKAHPDLRGEQDLLSSGRLADILLGRASLYADLPPVHLSAYLDGLRPAARRELEQHLLSALEHLASHGWRSFSTGRPLGKDLDPTSGRASSPPGATQQAPHTCRAGGCPSRRRAKATQAAARTRVAAVHPWPPQWPGHSGWLKQLDAIHW